MIQTTGSEHGRELFEEPCSGVSRVHLIKMQRILTARKRQNSGVRVLLRRLVPGARRAGRNRRVKSGSGTVARKLSV